MSLVTGTPEVRNARRLILLVLYEAMLVVVNVVAAFARWSELDLIEDVVNVVDYDFYKKKSKIALDSMNSLKVCFKKVFFYIYKKKVFF